MCTFCARPANSHPIVGGRVGPKSYSVRRPLCVFFFCYHLILYSFYFNRPYAYDVTKGPSRVLGVKRGTVPCAIAKHAASGPTPACHTAVPARACALTEAESANALPAQHVRAARQVLTPNMASLLWRCDVNA